MASFTISGAHSSLQICNESDLVSAAQSVSDHSFPEFTSIRESIQAGNDPLGDAFCALRSAAVRRGHGAVFTPAPLVQSMVAWAASHGTPDRIIDPGTGSGRFLLRAGKVFPKASLIGIEADPLVALLARANLEAAGLGERARVVCGDYRDFCEETVGRTLYIGNPPYVRHHQIAPDSKEWLSQAARRLGFRASQLAGLHVHFFLATAIAAKAGDFGAFVTSSEWLDVNYGSLVRSLVRERLGGRSITLIEPTAQPFPDASTTASITTFEVGTKPASVFFQRVASLHDLSDLHRGTAVPRGRLSSESRWSVLGRSDSKPPHDYVELGEICRVHRGQVTGANAVWIAGQHSDGLPDSVLFRTVTKAREVFAAEGVLRDASNLRFVIDIPADLDELDAIERAEVDRFLKVARERGADTGFIATHRKAWWSVRLHPPAPIIATYMARRAPAFAINKASARHINIAHGLYPREAMSDQAQASLVRFLHENVSQDSGRTYAGGLTKFEPREMERLIVPTIEMLTAGIAS